MAAMSPRPFQCLAPGLLALLLLPGCMTVHLHSGEAEPRVLRHFGWLQVEVPQAEQAVVGRLQGLGLVSTPRVAQRWRV